MKPMRSLGNLSALQSPSIAIALKTSTAKCKNMSSEELKRLKHFFVTVKPMTVESKTVMQAEAMEVKVRTHDIQVDRDWVIVRDVTNAYARLEGVTPIGDEAARLQRKYLSDMEFLRYDTTSQATHGKTLIACLAEEPMSKELSAILRPALTQLQADHVAYEEVVQESMLYTARVSALQPLRREAVDALQSFVTLAEIMAETPEQIAQLNAMLAPIDSCLAKMKPSASRSTDKDEPEQPEQPEAPKKPEGVQS